MDDPMMGFATESKAAYDATVHEDVLALIHEVRCHQVRVLEENPDWDMPSDVDLWIAVDEIAVKYGL